MNDHKKQYTLHFASPELKKNETTMISKGYRDMSVSEIVNDILVNDLHFTQSDSVELFVEDTQYVEPAISFPYMKPFDIIKSLSKKALRRNNKDAANFLLFENKRGVQFRSIESLLSVDDQDKTKFRYGNAVQNRFAGVNQEQINKIQIQSCYDIIANIRAGVYASKHYSYDMETGKTHEHIYNYSDKFSETKSIDGDNNILSASNQWLSDRPFSNIAMSIQTPSRSVSNITSEPSQAENTNKIESGSEEYLQRRLSQIARLSNFRMLLEISGNSKHKVGDVVTIDIKTAISKENIVDFTEESNAYYSGDYLISSIKHVITKYKYDMHVETMKDSYQTEIE